MFGIEIMVLGRYLMFAYLDPPGTTDLIVLDVEVVVHADRILRSSERPPGKGTQVVDLHM